MNKMDNSQFQEMARQDRNKLIASIVAIAVSATVIFIIGLNMQNMALAKAIFIPAMLAIVCFVGFIVLRLTSKMERDSFQDGMHIVMESVPMVCSLYDMNNNIKYCNDKAPKLFGFRDREEYSRNYASSFPEFQPDGTRTSDLEAKTIQAVKDSGSTTTEWYQKTSNGTLIPLHLTMIRTYFQGEQHILEFTRDKRQELEAAKQEAAVKERMQAILDASPMLCALYDGDGNVLEVNREAERMFDIPDKQIFANNFNDFTPQLQPDGTTTSQKAIDTLNQTLRDGYTRYEFMYQRKDGTPIPTEEIMSRITVDGKPFVISYSRDLREFYANKEKDALIQQNIQTMMEQLNGNVSEQAAAVTESAAAIEEMVANIQSVTSVLTKNADQVQELQSASEVGNNGINEVVADIRGIAAESESLLEINSVMANIANQTNLLSMNAAIEAAHAGEAGRGFAVVADEIRKLAESSSKQSKTISSVLKTIKASIDKITKSAENVLNRFDTIDGGIKTVAEQERGVLNAMEEQKQGSEQVLQAIGQVSDITQRVKNDAQQMVKRQASAMTS
ncbi:MAG: PAS domain-containing methyl-accepting chemotaxis protein [Treponema sp.]|nr:PAS domain-containing methyl-accepting chemotaxis protein [Treponema sp.]